jgi:hypothetical protein
MVKAELMAWCRAEAGLPQMANAGVGDQSTQVVNSEVADEEDEVEAMGECSVFERCGMVEAKLMAWCQAEAGLPQMMADGTGEESTQQVGCICLQISSSK